MFDSSRWGVRSRVTNQSYLLAKSQDEAELLQAATGRLDIFDIVQDIDGELTAHATRPGAPPIPAFATKAVDPVGEDEEIVRLAVVMRDPMYGVEMQSLTITAEELLEQTEKELRANLLRWCWYRVRIRLYHWRGRAGKRQHESRK